MGSDNSNARREGRQRAINHAITMLLVAKTGIDCQADAFVRDKTVLWTTHWDSHFSFLCSSDSNLNAIPKAYHFEGFFCDRTTEVYWSVRL
jgi:hypothetical protein